MNERIRLCAMGDSITRGIGMPENAPCWVEQLEHRFHLKCINLSQGGESSRQALSKIEELRCLKPDIVTLQYGMNDHYLMEDGNNNVPEKEFEQNLLLLTEAARNAEIILITNHSVLEGDDEHYYYHRHALSLYRLPANLWINRYNEVIRNIARRKSLHLVDMWEIAAGYPPEDFLRSRKNTPLPLGDDGVHPHLLGGEVYARSVGKVIEEILRKKEASL